ncbi:MAG: cbb3-type cytochrome c oxidase subunit I [Oscillochloridaceae bacterium]|nr:cbb3-type cytochrome c oxidase subunit I [Chloroflexaceae bacterium]MDW8390076.1 cbb3-type cytochrome c oxidase subunit I [Oscillochloridaceae bacterium]
MAVIARPRAAARADVADRFATENRVAGLNILVAFLALGLGGLMGVLQVLQYNGIDLYKPLKAILPGGYYQGLTLHGVLNVLVFTTFYIIGFLTFVTARSFDRPLSNRGLTWFTFYFMTAGLLIAAVPILLNKATVMFTFYPPLKANGFFYLGLTMVVVGTYFLLANQAMTLRDWRRDNPGAKVPLAAFMAIVTMTMWVIATFGVAVEMLVLLLPWAFGLVPGTDPLLARTLFWFTGHPIVYFWLLPAYISWYTIVPRLAGGKLFSEPMARVSFLLFLVLSVPIGMHHQYTDPGISQIWKLVHFIFTVGVFFPSLLTFFNVVASLEHAGRSRGGKGWLAWIFALPWNEPAFVTQVFAMMLFAFGGASGVINASYNLNLVVHNTAWISGHFHLTVGSAVALTFMGLTYWLLPYLAGRELWSRGLALAQAWLWIIGMILFSHFMHMLGLAGMPRRTMIGSAPYVLPEWERLLPLTMIGGLLMFASALCFLVNMVMTLTAGRRVEAGPVTFARALSGPEDVPAFLDRLTPWVLSALVLVAINYGPTLYFLATTGRFNIPGLSPW